MVLDIDGHRMHVRAWGCNAACDLSLLGETYTLRIILYHGSKALPLRLCAQSMQVILRFSSAILQASSGSLGAEYLDVRMRT